VKVEDPAEDDDVIPAIDHPLDSAVNGRERVARPRHQISGQQRANGGLVWRIKRCKEQQISLSAVAGRAGAQYALAREPPDPGLQRQLT